MLRLADDWVWDSWIADDGRLYQLFFLKAPRKLGDPRLRHIHATIGHATSPDLVHWDLQPDALHPAVTGFDDLALWTGSVLRGDDGLWRLYYTALSTARGLGVRDQRIGMAESDDLFEWRRACEEPLVCPDPRWYQTLEEHRGSASETWRDPFVFEDSRGDGWHMLITARRSGAPRLRDGILAHARSVDMRRWELQPPLTEPAGFGQLEVPQVRILDGQALLVFTCHPEEQTTEQVTRFGPHSTWYVLGNSTSGPWNIAEARPFEGEPNLFAACLVQRRDRGWAFVGFRNQEPEGILSFEILDPIPVQLRDGELRRVL